MSETFGLLLFPDGSRRDTVTVTVNSNLLKKTYKKIIGKGKEGRSTRKF